jgi:hypothetical protein
MPRKIAKKSTSVSFLNSKSQKSQSAKMFIMFKTLFITTKTITSISKVPKPPIIQAFDNLLRFVDKTITAW